MKHINNFESFQTNESLFKRIGDMFKSSNAMERAVKAEDKMLSGFGIKVVHNLKNEDEEVSVEFYHSKRLIAIIKDHMDKLGLVILIYDSEIPSEAGQDKYDTNWSRHLTDDQENKINAQSELPYAATDILLAKVIPGGLSNLVKGMIRWWYKYTNSGKRIKARKYPNLH